MKRTLIIVVLAFIANFLCYAQKKVASLTVQHIEIKQVGEYGSTNNPDYDSIQLLALVNNNYRNWYKYWTFSNSNYHTSSMSDGSEYGMFSSSTLNINTWIRGQELEIELKNRSLYWLSLDLSTLFYSIFFYNSAQDYWAPYQGGDHEYSLGVLFNYNRGAYNVVLLPPGASTTCTFFRIDGYSHGYDIISSPIKNKSRLDFSITMKLYLSDPFTQMTDLMQSPSSFGYAQQTPKQRIIPYKGAFFKEGESILLLSGNENCLLPEFKTLELKCICNVNVYDKVIQTHINDVGLEVYGR